MFKNDVEIQKEIAKDGRTIGAQLDSILLDKQSREHAAYFNSADPLHDSTVRKVEYLMLQKHGGEKFDNEVFPVISSTKKEEPDSEDFGGEDDEFTSSASATIRFEMP